MGEAELDAFLTAQRTCRVATVGQDGPHLTPLCRSPPNGRV
jgi:nitroimidazol reductase NimA-like FMN-containing flavoprotein (pyridoxamine 5'-phosphate oxidase superfamily)